MAKAKVKLDSTTQKATLKKVMQCISRYRFLVVLSILLAAISVALTLYVPILVGDAIDFIVAAGQVNFDQMITTLTRVVIVVAITALAQWLMNVINNKITYQVIRDMRDQAFRKIQVLPLKYIDSHPYGEVVSRVIADVDQFADGLLMGFSQLFTGVITILGTLIFMLTVNVGITFVVVLLTPLSLFVANFIARRTFSMFKKQSEARAEQTALVDEMVGNEKVVQAFTHEAAAQETFDEINERLRASSLKAIFYQPLHALHQQRGLCRRRPDGRAGCGFRRDDGRRPFRLPELRQPIYQALQRDLRRHHGAAKRTGLRRAPV